VPLVHLFSTKVADVHLAELRAGKCVTSGGTDIACVAEHMARNRVTRALLVTDGWVGTPRGEHHATLAKTRLAVAYLGDSTHQADLAAVARGSKTLQSIFKSSQDANAEAAERAKTDPDLAEVLRHRKMMVNRIGIGVNPKQAGISIADRDGNDRIVMLVSDSGEPEILILDADGKEVARIPERKEKP
jgi:hypothetical protein